MMAIGDDMAGVFARLTMRHLTRPWPYRLDQTLTGPLDLAVPQTLHPIFYGSFDWHSCVHGWWQVMTLSRCYPRIEEAGVIAALADQSFTSSKVAVEKASLERPANEGFERPYGWGWLLALHAELAQHEGLDWHGALKPLAQLIARRFADYLPKLTYPVRSGKHDNTAFALLHALRWARGHDAPLATLIENTARRLFANDRDVRPLEPGGEDFLSATLCEAVLMREVLDKDVFQSWFQSFFPDPFAPHLACLRSVVAVSDRADGRLAHLDGLNLSRAWCWRMLAGHLPDPAKGLEIARDHLDVALPHLADDYMGEHWLATFALLAIEDPVTPR